MANINYSHVRSRGGGIYARSFDRSANHFAVINVTSFRWSLKRSSNVWNAETGVVYISKMPVVFERPPRSCNSQTKRARFDKGTKPNQIQVDDQSWRHALQRRRVPTQTSDVNKSASGGLRSDVRRGCRRRRKDDTELKVERGSRKWVRNRVDPTSTSNWFQLAQHADVRTRGQLLRGHRRIISSPRAELCWSVKVPELAATRSAPCRSWGTSGRTTPGTRVSGCARTLTTFTPSLSIPHHPQQMHCKFIKLHFLYLQCAWCGVAWNELSPVTFILFCVASSST